MKMKKIWDFKRGEIENGKYKEELERCFPRKL